MQFPEKIVGIKPGDKVLDIGPGGTPHPAASVFLELKMGEDEAAAQRGFAGKPELGGKVVYYDGKKFPFTDKEFDYVVCSHVIEHVPDPELFMSEMFRVAKSGYLEYPTIFYEYLYNFDVHRNFIKWDDRRECLLYFRKSDTSLDEFSEVQKFFKNSLECGHDSLVASLKEYMFEGFEWRRRFKTVHSTDISSLAHTTTLPLLKEGPAPTLKGRVKAKIKRIIRFKI